MSVTAWQNPLRDPARPPPAARRGPLRARHLRRHGRLCPAEADAGRLMTSPTGLLPPGFSLWVARREWADQDFAQVVHDSVKEHARTPFREEVWAQLAEACASSPGRLRRRHRVPSSCARPSMSWTRSARTQRHTTLSTLGPASSSRRSCGSSRSTASRTHRRARGARRHRGAVRHDIESAAGLNAIVHDVFAPWEQVFPHRPLPRQGRPSRTSWRSASPTRCTSRSGTGRTSTTCRSRWPRISASAAAPATTTASAPPATSSRTTSSS